MSTPMQRCSLAFICLTLGLGFVSGVALGPARAEDDPDCLSCRSEDENQVGGYTEPVAPPAKREMPNPKGTAYQLPLPGSPTVHHRAGAGVWLGEVGEGNNVYLNPRKDKLSLGVKRDF